MAKVPTRSGGVSRRSYQAGYSKTAAGKVGRTLGALKLTTPSTKQPRRPRKSKDQSVDNGNPMNVSFGRTGFTEEEWNV